MMTLHCKMAIVRYMNKVQSDHTYTTADVSVILNENPDLATELAGIVGDLLSIADRMVP